MIRVIIVDDDRDAALALKRNIDGNDVIQVVGIFNNGREAVEGFISLHPDLILMDIRMPVMDGLEAGKRIKQADPLVKVLILTLFSEKEEIVRAININCDGYVNKGHKSEELITIIKNTCQGMNTFENGVQAILHDYVMDRDGIEECIEADKKILEQLSKRELDIITLITEGRTNSEIAATLFLSEGYVRNQLVVIREKLGLRNSKELAVWGAKMGL